MGFTVAVGYLKWTSFKAKISYFETQLATSSSEVVTLPVLVSSEALYLVAFIRINLEHL